MSELGGDSRIIRQYSTATASSNDLVAIETKYPTSSKCARMPIQKITTKRLSSILNNFKRIFSTNVQYLIKITRISIRMHWNHSLNLSTCSFIYASRRSYVSYLIKTPAQGLRVNTERFRTNINKMRNCIAITNCIRCCDKSQWRHHHFHVFFYSDPQQC